MRRTGLIARKLGMTRLFLEGGEQAPATVLFVEDCRVLSSRTVERDGYAAVRLCAGSARASRVGRARRGEFSAAGVAPAARLAEFRVDSEDALLEPGARLSPSHFVPGQRVDVSGVTSGKGFAGAMKRHGFGGGRATHGTSISHRAHGSTGNHQDPGRVFKGKKMAGHMGARRRTAQNLEVLRVEPGEGLIFLRGSVPAVQDGWVLVRDAVKARPPEGLPFPAALDRDAAPGEAPDAAPADAAPEAPAEDSAPDAAAEAAPESPDAAPGAGAADSAGGDEK